MFDAGSMEFSRRLQTKNLVFGVIAAMMAYVLWHNERFLIEPLSPIWKHYRDLGVFLLVHGVAGGSALILAPMQFLWQRMPRAPDHQPEAKIFIPYSRKDIAFADRLDAALTRCELRMRRHQKGGLRCPTA